MPGVAIATASPLGSAMAAATPGAATIATERSIVTRP
jgi:hypothetical protein